MSVALPSYTIQISKNKQAGVLIKHNALLSTCKQLHPYPKNTWSNICEVAPPPQKWVKTLWTHASRLNQQLKHSTFHNFLCRQHFLVQTLPALSHTYDSNTNKSTRDCTINFKRYMSAKKPIPRQNNKKGEQRGGKLPPNNKNIAHTNLPHIPITPSLTPSS